VLPDGRRRGLLDGKSVCICAGSGGVGKTTSAAAIATGMAARKRSKPDDRPAKRLADSLGLPDSATRSAGRPARFAEAGIRPTGVSCGR
jgi:Mrp family chromosome partitioning ATPase